MAILAKNLNVKESMSYSNTLGINSYHALQDGDGCGGALLETCTKDLQELRRAVQKRLLQQHKVSPHYQRIHGARRRPYRNRWVHHTTVR